MIMNKIWYYRAALYSSIHPLG